MRSLGFSAPLLSSRGGLLGFRDGVSQTLNFTDAAEPSTLPLPAYVTLAVNFPRLTCLRTTVALPAAVTEAVTAFLATPLTVTDTLPASETPLTLVMESVSVTFLATFFVFPDTFALPDVLLVAFVMTTLTAGEADAANALSPLYTAETE